MRESGPRKRDEDDHDDGDVYEDDHHCDDSPLDGTLAPPRERRRGSPLLLPPPWPPPGWGEVIPLVLGLHGDDGPFGSSSMASGDDGPLQQGAEEGLDWFLVVLEACDSGTSDLGLVLEFPQFIGVFGVEDKSRGPKGSPQDRGHALGGDHHPCGALGTPLR